MTDYIFASFIIVPIIYFCWYYYHKNFKNRNNIKTEEVLPEKQQDHEIILPKKRRTLVVTLEESWKFINQITEEVMAKFSNKDQELLLQIGKTLSSLGMIYNHVIEYGVRNQEKINKSMNKHKSDKSDRSI